MYDKRNYAAEIDAEWGVVFIMIGKVFIKLAHYLKQKILK